MKVEYKNTFADVLWANAHTGAHSPIGRVFYAAFCVWAYFYMFTYLPVSLPMVARILGSIFYVLVASLILFLFLLVYGGIVLFLISKWSQAVFTLHTITITETVLIEETEFCRTEHKWAGITRLVRTPRHILAYVSKFSGHIIPRRAFRDAAAWDLFYAELASRVPRSN